MLIQIDFHRVYKIGKRLTKAFIFYRKSFEVVELLEIKAKIIESGWTMTKIVEELNKRHNTKY